MKNPFLMSGLTICFLLGGCDSHHGMHVVGEGIRGETPMEVAVALQRMGHGLNPRKAEEFSHAVDTLARVVPDKHDGRTVGQMSPQFVQMVQGRNADQIIQLAVLYRISAPPDRRR